MTRAVHASTFLTLAMLSPALLQPVSCDRSGNPSLSSLELVVDGENQIQAFSAAQRNYDVTISAGFATLRATSVVPGARVTYNLIGGASGLLGFGGGEATIIVPLGTSSIMVNVTDGGANATYAISVIAEHPWTAPEPLEPPDTVGVIRPQVAVDESGGSIAVWQRNAPNIWSIWANRYVEGSGWGNAQPIENSDSGAMEPVVAMNPAGDAAVVWDEFPGVVWSSRYVVGQGWEVPEAVSDPGGRNDQVSAVASGGGDTWFAAFVEVSDDRQASDVSVSVRTGGGGWSVPQVLDSEDSAGSTQLAANDVGDAIAAWRQRPPATSAYSVWVSQYTAGAWQAAQRLNVTANSAFDVRVGIAADTGAVAVWSEQLTVLETQLRISRYEPSTGWDAPVVIGGEESSVGHEPDVAMNAQGDAVVVWMSGQGDGIGSVEASYCPRGSTCSPATPLQIGDAGTADPQVGIDAGGNAIAAWSAIDGNGRNSVWVNRFSPDYGWEAALELTSDVEVVNYIDLAVDSSGRATVVWTESEGAIRSIWASRYE